MITGARSMIFTFRWILLHDSMKCDGIVRLSEVSVGERDIGKELKASADLSFELLQT